MSTVKRRPRTVELSGEDRLIARHFKPLARHPGAFGLVDDAAVLTPPAIVWFWIGLKPYGESVARARARG